MTHSHPHSHRHSGPRRGRHHFGHTLVVAAAMLAPLSCGEACGHSSVGNNALGQVKRVHHETPWVCPNYDTADISLGVLVNGVGSMTPHDVLLSVNTPADYAILQEAADTGALVKITYDVYRASICRVVNNLTHVELAPVPTKP